MESENVEVEETKEESGASGKDKYKLKRLWILLLVPIAIAFLVLSKISPWIAEYVFARGYYYLLGNLFSYISGFFPVSLAELLVVLGSIIFLIAVIVWIVRMLDHKDNNAFFIFYKGIINFLDVVAIILFFVISFAMVNINRYSFAKQADLEIKDHSAKQLYALCLDLTQKCNQTKEKTSSNKKGEMELNMNFKTMQEEAKKAYKRAGKEFKVLNKIHINAKPVHFSRAMSFSGIIGVYTPFTVEANIDTDICEYKQPATMCHEIAHLQGYMKEDEANYIAYLVCKKSKNPAFQYSGYMSALSLSLNSLQTENKKLYEKVYQNLSASVKNDLRANAKYWNRIYESQIAQNVEKATNSFNDSYLKISGQKGVKSYGLAVDLLLAERDKKIEKREKK